MAFAQERRHDRRDQHRQQPGREPQDAGRQCRGRHELLQHQTHGLDHRDAVGGLHARSLQFVVEHRVLVGGQIQTRGVFHDPNAHVAREAVRQKRVEISDGPSQYARQSGQRKLGADQEPKARGQRMTAEARLHAVENALRHRQHRERNQRRADAAGQARRHHAASRFPDDRQQRRDVPQRPNALPPRAGKSLRAVNHER